MTWRPPTDLERFLLADTNARWPELIPLARLLVLAPRIEPLLLRNARRRFLPGAEAQLESQLWFSPLVASRSTREVLLHLGIARVLAGRLGGCAPCPGDPDPADDRAAAPPTLTEVWDFTRDHSRHWPPEDRLERDLRYFALCGDEAALAGGLRAILARIAAESGADETSRIDLSRLVKRTLPVIRPGLGERSGETARLLARYAALALGDGGDWSAEAQPGWPEALPAWLQGRLPAPLAQARLGVEVRWDETEGQVLHLVEPREGESAVELPGPLPGRLHLAPGGQAGLWHPVTRGTRIPIAPPSAVLRLSTLDGRQWDLVTESLPAGPGPGADPPPLLLVHAPPDLAQAQAIAGWLRGQGVPVELVAETPAGRGAPVRPTPVGPVPVRSVRLWTRAASDLWAGAAVASPADQTPGLLLRTEPVDPPAAGAAGGMLDWHDWQRLAESPRAAELLDCLGRWWREGDAAQPAAVASHATEMAAVTQGSGGPRTPAPPSVPSVESPRAAGLLHRLGRWWREREPAPLVLPHASETAAATQGSDGPRPPTPPVSRTENGGSRAEVARLLAEIADPKTEPERRLAIGDRLAELGDPRPGVGLRPDGLPDIDWVEVPAGTFLYGENKERRKNDAFRIARVPITNLQYQAFIDAGGYREARWWAGLEQRIESPADPGWKQPNRPRESLSWNEAMAYCVWLSDALGLAIRLPTEWEWERAARWTDGRGYPWGDDYRAGYANIDETYAGGPTWLHQTTAVGIYPHGASPDGVLDLAGNVWECCLNEYEHPKRIQPGGIESRVVRGGSWDLTPHYARAASRYVLDPCYRLDSFGLRVLCVSPIH